MIEQSKIAGVVLAGGRARRMGQRDKGLVPFRGKPLAGYACEALAPLVDELVISANRNFDHYHQFGCRVVADLNNGFDGPLSGILATLSALDDADVLMVLPCDVPLLKSQHLRRLLQAMADGVDLAVACEGDYRHPVVLALRCHLRGDLADYLSSGQRKLQSWIQRHCVVWVDFSDTPGLFINLNTLDEVAKLELKN